MQGLDSSANMMKETLMMVKLLKQYLVAKLIQLNSSENMNSKFDC